MRTLVKVGLVVSLCWVVACSSIRSRADDLYDAGRFLEAVELYDQVLHEHPGDAEVTQRRAAARNGALRVQLSAVVKARKSGHLELATVYLAKLFALRDGWQITTEPAIATMLALEIEESGTWLAGHVANRAHTAGPLVGEQIAIRFAALLDHVELASYRASIAQTIASAGRDACARLAPGATTPYWQWVAARYCEHFDAHAITAPKLPHQRAGLSIAGALTGMSVDELARLRTALAGAFLESVWYAPDGDPAVRVALSGSIASTFDSHPVTKYAEYTVEVPYTDYETQQESYQEPYDDTEYYTESVPSTEYHDESYSCGDTTCTRSVSQTVYHDESRTRTVTKYRTAWRTVTVPVTKYQTESRTFEYAAIERTGHYTSKLRLVFEPDLDNLVASVETDASEVGIDHDAEFSPAGVSPERANLTTASAFVFAEQQRIVAELHARLDALYATRYCRAEVFSLEDAARCAILDPKGAPSAARGMLRVQLGEDETLLSVVLARK
jgi:hypothetical protein